MAIFVADSHAFVALWDYDHPSNRAATRFFDRDVRPGSSRLIAPDLAWFDALQGVATSLGDVTPSSDIGLALYSDMRKLFTELQRDDRLELARTGYGEGQAAFLAAIAWRIPLLVAVTAALAQVSEVPIVTVAGARYSTYSRLASEVSGLEVRLLQ